MSGETKISPASFSLSMISKVSKAGFWQSEISVFRTTERSGVSLARAVRKEARFSGGACAKTSTYEPLFATLPRMPQRSATRLTNGRNPTPWTMPKSRIFLVGTFVIIFAPFIGGRKAVFIQEARKTAVLYEKAKREGSGIHTGSPQNGGLVRKGKAGGRADYSRSAHSPDTAKCGICTQTPA